MPRRQMPKYRLFCLIENDSEPFDIYVRADETVSSLKKTIITQGLRNDLNPKNLKLWQVDKKRNEIKPGELDNDNSLDPTWKIGDYWNGKAPEKCIHVYIRILGKLIAVDLPVLLQKISPEFAVTCLLIWSY